MEFKNLDLPQLIVALDSLNNDANYVHIKDVRENVTYYCPCCKGIVNPRAYKDDKEYQVQPHFYHETGGCNEETYIHYICKNWLFEKGCKFLVSGIEYEVDNIDTEKTLHTSFGDYRPDIIVTTTIDKIFYFEIRTTNKKTELYAPKWDELGNDVVEVDTRYFINQKHKNDVPEFELIYSNGECFIKSYSRTDYEDTIAKRKLEWKRQDKLNYKMQWEKLDWFWCELQKYIHKETEVNTVLNAFKNLDFGDMEFCIKIIHNHKLKDIEEQCIMINNELFDKKLNELKVELNQISSRRFYVYEQIIGGINHSFYIATTWTPKTKGIRFLRLIMSNLINKDIKERIIINLNNVDVQYKQYINEIKIDQHVINFGSRYYSHGTVYADSINLSQLNSDFIINDTLKKFKNDCFMAKQKEDELTKRQKEIFEKEKAILLYNNTNIKTQRESYEPIIKEVVDKINNCKNNAWKCEYQWVENPSKLFGYWECKKEVKFTITFIDNEQSQLTLTFDDLNYNVLTEKLTKEMNYIIKHNGLVLCCRKRRIYRDSASSRVLFVRGE